MAFFLTVNFHLAEELYLILQREEILPLYHPRLVWLFRNGNDHSV